MFMIFKSMGFELMGGKTIKWKKKKSGYVVRGRYSNLRYKKICDKE